ncbi:MAG: glycosyltransferase [Flavobacterium sp.]|nr:MAG: glycosyltransferase [Flavobacterium sp.]
MKAPKVLVYSTFPPVKCGVGTYAAEHVLALKHSNQRVYLASTDSESSAHFHVDLKAFKSILKFSFWLLKERFQEIHLHYSGEFYFPNIEHHSRFRKPALRLLQVLSIYFVGLLSGRKGSIIFHESYPGQTRSKILLMLRGLAFGSFGRVEFHTAAERTAITGAFGKLIKPSKVHLVDHNRFMTPKYLGTRELARRELGIPQDIQVFLCIGFIQAHKGFHSAVEAFGKAARPNSKIYVVGSMRQWHPEIIEYRHMLADLMKRTPGAELRESFVTDEDFDRWIIASDAVILPYREISSSGVGARAVLCDRSLMVNNLENLKMQFGSYAKVATFEDWNQLSTLITDFVPSPSSQINHNRASSIDINKKILFVMPWFGPNVKAGAEGFIYSLCFNLVARGIDVEVWTTASSTLENRNNNWMSSIDDKNAPFRIRRFKANKFSELIFRLIHPRISQGGKFADFFGRKWAKSALNGKGMARELKSRGNEYSTIHLCHYFGGSTHALAGIMPYKTIIHPFIHDEPAFYNSVMSDLFAGSVGVLANSEAERVLSQTGRAGILRASILPIGNGVSTLVPRDENALRPRNRHIVYIGRLIPEKNIFELVHWVETYNQRNPEFQVDLVLIGDGPLKHYPSFHKNPRIKVCGRLPDEEKIHFIRDSLAVVQLSKLESFSLVMVEGWAERTPAIVHSDCLATRLQIEQSGGGLAVGNVDEFCSAVQMLDNDRYLGAILGEAGYQFAISNYTWDAVIGRFIEARRRILGLDSSYQEPASPSLRYPKLLKPKSLVIRDPRELDGTILRNDCSLSERRFLSRVGNDFYVQFERMFRDSSQAYKIFPSWERYLGLISELKEADLWLDLGAGRGFFLHYLESKSVSPKQLFGLEPDPASYFELRKTHYLSASMLGDEFLERVTDESFKVISMLHVAEHIPWNELCCLFKLAFEKLKKGGVFIVELPNCTTLKTSAVSFWGDPTHIRPLYEETLTFALKYCGFEVEEIGRYAPFIEDEKRAELGAMIGFPQLMDDIYGDQDLSIICRKP